MQTENNVKERIFSIAKRVSVLWCACAVSLLGVTYATLPDNISVRSSGADDISVSLPFVTVMQGETAVSADGIGASSYAATVGVFGIPLKSVTVNVYDDDFCLYPGGQTFGIRMNTKGVVVVGISEVEFDGGRANPALDAGIHVSDVIFSVNGTDVNTVDEVTDAVAKSNGAPVKIGVQRDGKANELTLNPVKSKEDGFYRAGLWIRDCTAGIGTVTYVNPEDLSFGGLGHGVCDADTGELMPLGSGTVFSVTVSDIVKGRNGSPGELKGYFNAGKTGIMTANDKTGVYGIITEKPKGVTPVEIGLHDEVKSGPAVIRCALNDGEVKEYDVTIEKLPGMSEEKNMVVHVTDDELIEKTGGIIQGMSGSPIMQDGKLIGAVTHVLINDPTTGYGIFIENMLEAAA